MISRCSAVPRIPTSRPRSAPISACRCTGAGRRFADNCLEVQLQANCRECDVFLDDIEPLVAPSTQILVELLLMLDATRGFIQARTTVVMPHYAYARSTTRPRPEYSIGGQLVTDLLTTAGAGRVLALACIHRRCRVLHDQPVDRLTRYAQARRPLSRV